MNDLDAEQARWLQTHPPRKAKSANAEWRLQASCVKATKRAMRDDPNLRFIASMAENHRTQARAAIAKMMGLQPGVADIILLRRHVYGLKIGWVELKRPSKQLSESQRDWAEWFSTTGVECHRCDSLDQFRAILAAF